MSKVVVAPFGSKNLKSFADLLAQSLPIEVGKRIGSKPRLSHNYFDEQDVIKHLLSRISHYRGVSLETMFHQLMADNPHSREWLKPSGLKALRKYCFGAEKSIDQTAVINYIPSYVPFERQIIQVPTKDAGDLSCFADQACIIDAYNGGNLAGKYLVLIASEKKIFGTVNLVDVERGAIEFLWTKWLICGRHPSLVNIGGLDAAHVSRVHCMLMLGENNHYHVLDMMSQNGTSLMTESEFERYLEHGEPIRHERTLEAKGQATQEINTEDAQSCKNDWRKFMLDWHTTNVDEPLILNLTKSVLHISRYRLRNAMKISFSAVVTLTENDNIRATNMNDHD